jgi:hypothetical protein
VLVGLVIGVLSMAVLHGYIPDPGRASMPSVICPTH